MRKREALGRKRSSAKKTPRSRSSTQPKAKATTFRIEPRLEQGLELVRAIEKKPLNKLVNEAIAELVENRTATIQGRLESVLAQVKAYRRKDPRFQTAITAFVDAEANLGGEDPAEGVVDRKSPDLGPAQTLVRDLLTR